MDHEFSFKNLDPDPPDPRRGERISVLLIEDSEVDAMVVDAMLREQGCEVSRAHSLADGLTHLHEFAADAVLLDLGLPDTEGVEGIHRLRAAFPHLPTIVVTGREDEGVVPWAMRAGAQDYLCKERLDAEQILRALRYAMARKQSERLRQRLEHADRLASLGQLSAGIAHEINNPLAFLIANMEMEVEHVDAIAALLQKLETVAERDPELRQLLADSDHGARLAEMRDILTDNVGGADRIRTIVRDLRGFARSDSAQMTPVDINETVLTAINITRNEIRHRARLETDLGDLPVLTGDQARLCQVVVNLLVNAAQAIDEGHTDSNLIQVTTRAAGNGVRISVRDTGCGIPARNIPRLFEPFFTTKPRDAGTGLGLALCAETVQRHNGHIDVKSEVGQGTTIELQLPAEHGMDRPLADVSVPPMSVGEGRILLVDDEPSVRRAFARTLEREGYATVQAGSGIEALQILERDQAFDAIVTDLVMPDLDGPEFYRHVSTHYPRLRSRLVFISGGAFTQRARSFLKETRVPLLSKPPRRHDLQKAIRDVAKAG